MQFAIYAGDIGKEKEIRRFVPLPEPEEAPLQEPATEPVPELVPEAEPVPA